MHKTIAAVFFAAAVVALVIGNVPLATGLAAGGLFMFFIGPKVEGES